MLNSLAENESNNQNPNLEILFFTSSINPHPKIEKYLVETIEKRKLPIKVTKIDVLRVPEAAEKHNIIVCPTLIFRDFMKVYGNCEQEELEDLLFTYGSLTISEFQHQSVIATIGESHYV